MSLYFNIRANLALSYFVILFFNCLQGRPVFPSSIHFVIFKNSFLLNHEDAHDVKHTMGNNMMYTIHPWVFLSTCALSFMSKYLHQSCGPKPMTRVDINDNNQSSNNFGVDGGMHVFIDGGNVGTELSHFMLVFYEIIVQGIEASFQVLDTGVGHDEEGTRKGAGGTTQKMGYG
jgi:hypothetical protein